MGRGLNSYLNLSLKNRFFNLGTHWDHKHTSTVPDQRGERHCRLSLCESGRTVRTMMVQGAHSAPPPSARVAFECFHLKALGSNAYVVLLKAQTYDRASNTRDTKAWWAADAIFPDSSTHCLLLKVYSLPQKLCPPWSSSCQLFTAEGKMTQLPLCTDLETLVTPTSQTRWTASLKILHAIQYPAFFNTFCLSNRRGHYGKTIKLQVKAAYMVGQRLYRRRMESLSVGITFTCRAHRGVLSSVSLSLRLHPGLPAPLLMSDNTRTWGFSLFRVTLLECNH